MIRLFRTHKVRELQELDGMWEFAATGQNNGMPEKYDHTLPVPGCWEMHPDFPAYRGKAAYRKTIMLEDKRSLRLEFKGVSHTANIYFDGRHVGYHYNAYTPFSVVIPHAEKGKHELVVLVDNTFSESSVLHKPNDYYTYGGITRPAVLEKINDCFIERIEFSPILDMELWKATIKVFLKNVGDECRKVSVKASLEAYELDFGEITVGKGEEGSISGTFEFDGIEPWNHKNPRLYLLETILLDKDRGMAIDDQIERVGFRTVAIEGRKLLVNGEEVFLKGFNRHEDHTIVGCSFPLQLMVKDIELVLDMGGNAIRTCHYPNDELFLDLCDEKGILVWEENHARGLELERMKHPLFKVQCENCNREMVQNHFNHPSIVIWGMLNECASHTEEGRELYIEQCNQIRQLDSSRPLSFASNRPFKDLCLDLPDIVSGNLYARWYHDDDVGDFFERFSKWVDETGGKGKPVILSEFGAEGLYGFRETTRVKGSEERQSDILDECLSVYLHRQEITGVFIWQFADCRVTEEDNWFLTRARGRNNKGIVDDYRRPKLSYETVKKHFRAMDR